MAVPARKQQITRGKFDNIDLRVARVLSAEPVDVADAKGTVRPHRRLRLDLGPLGELVSVGQFALVAEEDLRDRLVVACINLGVRDMGGTPSEALVLGTPHPGSLEGQSQALPLLAAEGATPGEAVF